MDVHRRVAALVKDIRTKPIHAVLNIHPAYCSVLIVFDPLETDHSIVQDAIEIRCGYLDHALTAARRTVEIPVCYGGEYGPDLQGLAQQIGISETRVIDLHASSSYMAYFVGFVPGFAYLGGLPAELAAPRLSAPRPKVPAGSVGIAGVQTGIYPFSTPGGWRLIGRTPLKMFRSDREPMSLIALGDEVRFVPIAADRFKTIEEGAR